ncbi:MAG: hypothetical protein EPO02_12705 [Nitrospirae bacterium]|uniref:hypothetical protein n=1 Tax=Aquabacterium sp. TaxID=1872578 RepID=UPI000F995B89|nr:hypothetical protein [Aquabacterium sp.]MBI3383439.1 hypothetical protein [Aquabacterium sp.]RTL26337.1 MAG: hypothetical protein EKK47_21365 [Burkholderiales bacterium]TAL08505.1 MAG: hypothetical protein EPO02_12705 [Nitrospirota bacterium]
MAKHMSLILWGGVSFLSACASLEREAGDYQAGWRRAQVLEIVRAGTVTPSAIKDCQTMLPPGASYAQFAVVSYSFGGDPNLRKKIAVGIPAADRGLEVGAWVSVNVVDCVLPLKRLTPA